MLEKKMEEERQRRLEVLERQRSLIQKKRAKSKGTDINQAIIKHMQLKGLVSKHQMRQNSSKM